jgi:hypothetical protein
MKSARLAEDTQTFVVCAEENRGSSKADRSARRRLESARRKLIRSIVRVCPALTDDEICSVAEYVLLVTT